MAKPLKILFLTDGISPYVLGGMQKHSLILSKLLAQKGHQVTLVHCGYTNQQEFNEDYSTLFTPEELKNLNIEFVPFIIIGKLPGHYIKANKHYSSLLFNKYKKKLASFDLIYAQGFTSYHFLNNFKNIPVWVNLHGFEMFQTAPNLKVKLQHYLLRPIVKTLTAKADYILSFGGKIDEILIQKLRVDVKKIIQQSNGIEKNWLRLEPLDSSKKRTFTFIGRYERRKGIEELTSALQLLVKDRQEFKFNFIGPIAKDKQFNHPSIHYLGEIKEQNVIKNILDQSDFLITPSYAEGMPTVILEAMARGNAILATDVGANKKMINGNGWLIESNPNSIKNNLIKAIDINKSDLLKMKQTSIDLVKENFIWEEVVNDLENVLCVRG